MKSIGDQVRDYRASKGLSTAQLAKSAGTKRQNIEQLEAAGNRLPKYLGALAAAMGTTVDVMLAKAGLKPKTTPAAPSAAELTPAYSLDPITISQAVHRLAEALMHMDPIGRHLAESAFVTLARQPEQPGTALEVLEVAIKNHGQPPPPPPAQPPSFSRKKKEAAQERKPGKVKLELKIGGGEKRQLALPLRTVRDPFDQRAASPRERAWYEKLKVAPKAARG